jgi:hypothetical protein
MQHQKATRKRYEQMQLADRYPGFPRKESARQGMAPQQEAKKGEHTKPVGRRSDAGETGQ